MRLRTILEEDLEKFFKKNFFSPKMRLRTKFSKNFSFTKRDLETISVMDSRANIESSSEKRGGD